MNSERIMPVTDATFEKEVLSSKVSVLVYCWESCSLSSMIDEIAEEYEGELKVVAMNIVDNELTASKYHIRNAPTYLIFANGVIADKRLVQNIQKHQLIAFISEYVGLSEAEIERRNKQEKIYAEQREKRENELTEQHKQWFARQRNWEEDIERLKAIEDKRLLICAHSDETGSNLDPRWLFPCSLKHDYEYNPETKVLIIEYFLPDKKSMPTLKELKYIRKDNKYKEIRITETQLNKLFDSLMYQLTLRLISDQFKTDTENKISSICFNGWVHSISKATGRQEDVCILSISVKKEQFLEIDLSNVDPKACFKHFKGVGCAVLSSMTPIPPILQINKADKRIVQGYDVIQDLEDATNIAAMDWQDFEHLVRELFEKEFMQNGGEVKVTQASRDGGVDAIAFDPDPLRGGKIIIQAKRYTNIVGVSAVRDLYGTVINEGATKGILITTANYGPDAYDFAKDKPITLLNGGHLLFMLQKHGQRARIDLKEAKTIIAEKEKAGVEGKNGS